LFVFKARKQALSYVTVCAKPQLLLTLFAYIDVADAEDGQKDLSVELLNKMHVPKYCYR